jgi:hypothetical protein
MAIKITDLPVQSKSARVVPELRKIFMRAQE